MLEFTARSIEKRIKIQFTYRVDGINWIFHVHNAISLTLENHKSLVSGKPVIVEIGRDRIYAKEKDGILIVVFNCFTNYTESKLKLPYSKCKDAFQASLEWRTNLVMPSEFRKEISTFYFLKDRHRKTCEDGRLLGEIILSDELYYGAPEDNWAILDIVYDDETIKELNTFLISPDGSQVIFPRNEECESITVFQFLNGEFRVLKDCIIDGDKVHGGHFYSVNLQEVDVEKVLLEIIDSAKPK